MPLLRGSLGRRDRGGPGGLPSHRPAELDAGPRLDPLGAHRGKSELKLVSSGKSDRLFSGFWGGKLIAAALDKRSFARVRPRGLVSLAMYQGERIPPAFGIVSDISETGACIHSDRVHFRGQKLQLRIQFASEPELFETQAKVCWIKPALGGENGVRGGALTGIEFHLP